MPVLKCIGGSHDGQYYEVNSLKAGEVFQIPERRYVVNGIVENRTFNKASDKYILHCFDLFVNGRYDTFSFLAPKEWGTKQAVEFQFRK